MLKYNNYSLPRVWGNARSTISSSNEHQFIIVGEWSRGLCHFSFLYSLVEAWDGILKEQSCQRLMRSQRPFDPHSILDRALISFAFQSTVADHSLSKDSSLDLGKICQKKIYANYFARIPVSPGNRKQWVDTLLWATSIENVLSFIYTCPQQSIVVNNPKRLLTSQQQQQRIFRGRDILQPIEIPEVRAILLAKRAPEQHAGEVHVPSAARRSNRPMCSLPSFIFFPRQKQSADLQFGDHTRSPAMP